MLRVHGGVVRCGMASGCRWHGVSGPVLVQRTFKPRSCFPLLWQQLLGAVTGRVVVCHCDNQAVVAALRGGYCREMDMAFLLRCLFFLEARYDLVLQAQFIPGVENPLADAISRNRLDVLFDLYPQVCHTSVRLNLDVVRSLVLDRHWTSDTWRKWLAAL